MRSNKLVILFICRGPFGFLGGAASYMFPKVLAEMGHTIKIISFADTFGKMDKVFATDRKNSFTVDEYWEASSLKRSQIVRSCISKLRPDIVHVFKMPQYYLLPIFTKFSGLTTPKWLIDIRSPPIDPDFSKPSFFKKIKRKMRFFHQIGFHAITTPVSSSAHANFFKVLKPLYEVPFGVDLSKIKKKCWSQKKYKDEVIKFVYIGSLSRQRRLETLILAINMVAKIKHKKNFQVDFYGVGNFEDHMRKIVKKMDLSDIIHFKGVIPQAQLFKELSRYDVGIGYVPYEQYMGSPALKVLEYMAANLLVIASDTEGIKKQVTHNINGLLFQNTPESISKTMLNIIENGFPQKIIEAGYKYASQNSWESVVKDRLLKVYNIMMNENKPFIIAKREY